MLTAWVSCLDRSCSCSMNANCVQGDERKKAREGDRGGGGEEREREEGRKKGRERQ